MGKTIYGITVSEGAGRGKQTAGRAGKPWWDMSGQIQIALTKMNPKTKHKEWLNALLTKLQEGKDASSIEELKLDFSSVKFSGKLKRTKIQYGTKHSKVKLPDRVQGYGDLPNGLRAALKCNKKSCAPYLPHIETLLKDFPEVEILGRAHSKKTKEEHKQAGWGAKSWKISAYCQKPQYTPSHPRIFVSTTAAYRKGALCCEDHVTLLSGILFEAGNVYVGNTDVKTDTHEQEVPVTLYNVARVLDIIAKGGMVSQNDWRNVIGLEIGCNMTKHGLNVNPMTTKWVAEVTGHLGAGRKSSKELYN